MKKMIGLFMVAAMFSSVVFAQGLPVLEESDRAPLLTMFNDSPPTITDQAVYPEKPYNDESITISARVFPDPTKASLAVDKVVLWYRSGDSGWISMPMLKSFGEEDRYFATVTPEPGADKLLYRIIATDVGGGTSVVLSPSSNSVDVENEAEFVWVEDLNEDDEAVPIDIDLLAVGVARDADNLYVIEKTEGKPGAGNMATTGANLYLAPLFPPTEGLSAFLGGQGKILAYAPMAAAMLGIPKYGLFNMPDLVAAFTDKKPVPKSNVKFKQGPDRLIFTIPNAELGEGDEFVSGVVALKYNPSEGQPAPWEATPFIRIIFRGGEVPLQVGGGPAVLKAGVATFEITPAIGTPFAGYGDRVGTPSEGAHDPLMGVALVLESDERYYALVGMDLFYMRMNVFNDIAKRVRDKIGMPEDALFLGASHSHHASGALIPELALLAGPFNPEVYESTVTKIVDGIVAAYNNLEPAAMGVGWIETREGRHINGNRHKDDGARDTVIGVIKVDTLDGKPLATLFNLSGHPTSISSQVMLFTSDFVGPARDAIAEMGGGTAVFFNGSLGDHSARCPDCQGDDWEVAAMKGGIMAEYVMEARDEIVVNPEVKLRGFTQWMILNRAMWWPSMIRGLVVDDKYAFISSPGELFYDDLGMSLRKLAQEKGFEQLFVLGLTNDGLGYIYPKDLYYKHVYESSYTAFGPGMSPFIRENMGKLVERMAKK